MHREKGPYRRRLPVGAEPVHIDGVCTGTHFRVWAPACQRVQLRYGVRETGLLPLVSEANGYFSGFCDQIVAGGHYRFELDSDICRADPASRFQPNGPHGPSEVIDPSTFQWTDHNWRGVKREGQVLYEMHIGTFTAQGTWQAAQDQLEELAFAGFHGP